MNQFVCHNGKCQRRFATAHALSCHESRCYNIKQVPVRSVYMRKRVERLTSLEHPRGFV
jgi:hypothetical protein